MPIPDLSDKERQIVADRYVELSRSFGAFGTQLKAGVEAYRYRNCGKLWRVYHCEKCHFHYRLPASCNSRICERCGARLFRSVQRRFFDLIKPFWTDRAKTYGPKFLTLTFQSTRWKATGFPTQADYKRCQKEVREFVLRYYSKYAAKQSRNGNWYLTTKWRGCGAIAVPELGKGNNLHFHLLVYGPVIPQAQLAATWEKITGDSKVVDIRQAKNPRQAVRYILKYITKPPRSDSFFDIASWAWLLKGSRRLVTYGVLYNQLPIKKKKTDKMKLACLYDGVILSYRGVSFDVKGLLIDWLSFVKYFDENNGPGHFVTFLDRTEVGLENKNFKLEF